MPGSDSYSNRDVSKYTITIGLYRFYFSVKRTEEQEREICSFVLLSKTYPNLYDSVVSYDTFVIYSASIRNRLWYFIQTERGQFIADFIGCSPVFVGFRFHTLFQ